MPLRFEFQGFQGICTGYIFKPPRVQVDEVARAVEQLKLRGMPDMTISRFYYTAVARALSDYRERPERFLEDYRVHMKA